MLGSELEMTSVGGGGAVRERRVYTEVCVKSGGVAGGLQLRQARGRDER